MKQAEGKGCVIYAHSKAEVKKLGDKLTALGLKVGIIHGLEEGVDRDQHYNTNADTQKRWLDGALEVVVANSAFGLGIDHPNVVLVIVYGLPDSIESFWQYAGRAARGNSVIGHCVSTINPATKR